MNYVKSGEGREFKWKCDHAFVKVSAAESGGLLSMIEDNLTADFVLPLHKHAEHAETFFIVDGVVEFIIEGEKGPDGMILDFDEVKEKLRAVLSEYDHRSLNDFMDYPSVENVCEMIRDKLEDRMEFSFRLRIWEGNGKWAEL